ncbi:MAG: DUF86 domain-containing protein [Candidatus Gastranaerophilales bacterium]|nr:DUF86 domain-containing protein [Candidatus Gastranaerophilales bacterium]
MDNKDIRILQKIYDHVVSILNYCNDCKELCEFRKNPMRVEACVFNLMQIGELAKTSISDETKKKIRTIPWKQLYGMRNRIVHGYSGVDMNIIWDTIHEDLPGLKAEIEKYL